MKTARAFEVAASYLIENKVFKLQVENRQMYNL